MSLLGRLIRRARGLPDAAPAIYGPVRTIEQELPYLHEQIRAYASFSPVRISGNSPLDNYTNETAEIRMAYRAALAEPTIKAALLGKISAVQALGLNVKPAADTPLDHEVADFVKDALNRCAVGTPMLAGIPGIVWEILTAGLIDGYSVCEKVWTRNVRGRFAGKISLQAIKAKDSRYLQFELNPYREITAIIPMIANSGVKYDPSDFVLFRYQSLFQNPFGLSDLRSSYRAATMIPAILRLRMMFLDKYTAPFIVTKVNDPALADRMRAEIARARGSGFLVMTAKDEFESVNLAMGGTADFQAGIEDLRKEAAIGISGAFLTIMTGSGGGETRGSSAVQQDTVDLFINALVQATNSCINGQIVPDLVGPNYGDRVDYPTAVLESPNPEQIVAELAIDETLDRLGVPLSLTDLYERSGRRPPKDDADKVTKPTGGGLPGMGGDQDFGGPGGPGGDDDNPFGGGDQPDTDVDTNDEDDDAATFAEPHSRLTGTITDSRGRKRKYVNGRQVSSKAAGKAGKKGRSGGGSRTPAGLPKNPKKLTIQQAHAALNKMGYTLGKSSYDPATRTQLYSMKFPSGKKGYLSTDEIKKLIYRAPSKAKPTPKPKPPAKPAPASKKPNTDEADHLTHVKTGAHDDAHGEDPYNAVPLHRDAPKARKWALDTAERLGPKLYKKLGLNNQHSGTATLYSALTKAAQRSLSGGSGTLVVKGPNGKTVKITVKHKPRADFAEGGPIGFQVNVSRYHEVAEFDEPTRHFTGTITDAAGRHRRYVEGRQVAAGKKGSGGKAAPSPKGGGEGPKTPKDAGPKPAGSEHAPSQEHVAAEVAAGLPPEFKKPGIIDRVMHFAARAYTSPKLFNAAVKLGTLVHHAAPEIFDTIEDFENPAKAKTSTGQPVGSATGNDPIYAHTGLPGYIALSIAAKVAGVIAGQVAKRWHSTHAEETDPVDLTLELIAAIRELSGNDAPLPSRDEVAAKLEEKRAARGTQQ